MASTGRKESPAALARLTMVNTSTLHGTATVSTAIVIGQMVNAFRPHQAVATDRPPSTSLVFDALEGISSPKTAGPSGFARPEWAISGHATLFCRSSARFVHAESFIRTVEDTYGMQEIGFAKSATVLRARHGLSIRRRSSLQPCQAIGRHTARFKVTAHLVPLLSTSSAHVSRGRRTGCG